VDSNDHIRERAEGLLPTQSIESFVAALKGDAPAAHLFRHCGRHLIDNPEIATALFLNRRCPPEFLIGAAKALPDPAIQEVMDDLDRLSAAPELASALLKSASLSVEHRLQLEELLRDSTEGQESFADAVATADIEQEKKATLLQRLARMRIVERVQLALKGNREERIVLIRDPCKVVQRAVLQSARLTDREVESFAAMASLTEEVLRGIATNKKFRRNYTIVRNLVTNPKTPLDITLHMLSNVNAQDLKALSTNKNVADTLRTAAMRLHRQRTQERH